MWVRKRERERKEKGKLTLMWERARERRES